MIDHLAPKAQKFILNTILDTNPTKERLFKMGYPRGGNGKCPLCTDGVSGESQTTAHILATCKFALGNMAENPFNRMLWRHNKVLLCLWNHCKEFIPSHMKAVLDLPQHRLHADYKIVLDMIAPMGGYQPDMILIDDSSETRKLIIAELSCALDACAQERHEEKTSKYQGLLKNQPSSTIGQIIAFEAALYPLEFLNAIGIGNYPPHNLTLKIGTRIMILRNLNLGSGLCNGTMLQVMALSDNVITAKILNGSHKNEIAFLPRITLTTQEQSMPFTLRRHQFPLTIAYAITINKSQSQSLDRVSVYLKDGVFAHGQLYVGFSRSMDKHELRVLMPNGNTIRNIVYTEVLQ